MMITSIEEPEETSGEPRGRPRLLKTYLMEANRSLPESFEGFDFSLSKLETGLPEISFLTLRYEGKYAKFLVDCSDRRFWVLHTNSLADEAEYLFNKLVFSPKANFDKVWLPTQMMQEIANLPRNAFKGFGLNFRDFFELDQQIETPVEELIMRVTGSSSILALKALQNEKKLQNSLAYSLITVKRGDSQEYVTDEINYEGRFMARGGTSIDAYNNLIEITSKKYKNLIEGIERNSLGIKEVENRTLIKGQAFDLNFKREIEDISSFLDVLVNSKEPFRIWGIKNKITNDEYQVVGVDLHTGDSIDFEVSPSLMRVYLPEGSCGNTVLRLYTNLQHYFDSNITLNDEPLQVTD